jgi:hypothetical protein
LELWPAGEPGRHAPAAYFHQLLAPLAGATSNSHLKQVETPVIEDGRPELRAVTGPSYGRPVSVPLKSHPISIVIRAIMTNSLGAPEKRDFP